MKIFTAITSIFYSMVLFTNKVYAQSEWGAGELDNINLGTRDLYATITGLINIVLGFLGVIALAIILYGGYLWMTSQGNVERVQKAKLTLMSGVIGLAIIVSAYAIASFVLKGFADATGVNTGSTTPPSPTIPSPCDCDATPGAMLICDVTPSNAGVTNVITIQGCNLGTAGTVEVHNATYTEIAIPIICSEGISWGSTRIQVPVPENLPLGLYSITVDSAVPATTYTYADSLNIVAQTGPSIFCLDPIAQAIGNTVDIQGIGFDTDINIDDHIFFEATGDEINRATADSWTDELITFTIPVGIETGNVQVILDDGATQNQSNLKQLGISCTVDGDCTTGCCWTAGDDTCRVVDPYCLDGTEPRIFNIDPPDAGPNNIVTITGVNFGTYGPDSNIIFYDGADHDGLLPNPDLNTNCINLWTDNTIVIGVPVIPSNNVQVSVVRDNGAAVASRSGQFNFEVNTTNRPGVCGLSPNIGAFGTAVTVHGVSFTGATDQVLFGGIADAVSSCGSALQCNATVPNLVANNVSVQVSNPTYSSNPYPFTVQETFGGDPIINEITPGGGPVGQYVTIKGLNFGNSQGDVTFDGDNTGVFSFPSQCQGNTWTDNTIIAKVPSGATVGPNRPVIVERSGDGKLSNTYDFDVQTGIPGPGLCAILPNNGPVGYPVHLYGDNFQASNADSDVTFYNLQSAGFDTWDFRDITTTIPPDAQSGDVVVDVTATSSNPISFSVGECETSPDNCSVGECCPTPSGNICLPFGQCTFGPQECEYTWEISTVDDPFGPIFNYCISPTPWPDDRDGIESREVYVSANLSLFFNRNVYNADLQAADNFRVYKCLTTDPFTDGLGDCAVIPIAGSLSVLSNGSDQEGLLFNPSSNLDEGTWYKVVYGDGLDGFRAQVGGDVWDWTDNPLEYWHFKTRTNLDVCYVDNINVTPIPSDSNFMYGNSRNFSALPMSANCNICGNQYNWDYVKTPAHANIDKFDIAPASGVSNIGHFTAFSNNTVPTHGPTENLSPPEVSFSAELVNIEDGLTKRGYGTSTVEAPRFRVVNRQPDCADACTNSQVLVTFSTPINLADINDTNFNLGVGINVTPEAITDRIVWINGDDGAGSDDFVINTTYNVYINPLLQDIYSNTLEPMTPWTFVTGAQGVCLVDSARIAPEDEIALEGSTLNYNATTYSAPGICYPSGQPIICNGTCAWDGFLSDIVTVASIPANAGSASSIATAISVGTTVIRNNAVQTGNTASPFPVFTDLTVVPPPPPPVYPNPNVDGALPLDGAANLCLNTITEISFDMPMNIASVKENFELFFLHINDLTIADVRCIDAPDIYNRIGFFPATTTAYNYLCTRTSGWAPHALGDEDFAIPGNFLPDRPYVAGVFTEGTGIQLAGATAPYSGVKSSNNMPLDVASVLVDIDDDGVDDGYFWRFDVGHEWCTPQAVEIRTFSSLGAAIDYSMFTCATNDCVGDTRPTQGGNQNTYIGMALALNGTHITASSTEFTWAELNGFVEHTRAPENFWASIVYVNPIIPPADGRDFLELTYTMTETPFLTLTDTTVVDVDICEVPWPPVAGDINWVEDDGIQSNFSTRYCQFSGNAGDTYLPLINYEPIDTRDLTNPILLKDFLLSVNPSTIVMNSSEESNHNFFGSLAYKGDSYDRFQNKQKYIWTDKLARLKDRFFDNEKVNAVSSFHVCRPGTPELGISVVNDTEVHLSMPPNGVADYYYEIRRAHLPEPSVLLGRFYAPFSPIVDTIVDGDVYTYTIRGVDEECDDLAIPTEIASFWSVVKTVGNPGLVDAIGIRVMKNPNNLSLEEWYRINAPNTSGAGNIIDVDGFRAMQVGNTVYIDGVNTQSSTLYKNIYILSYNIEAHYKTRDIFAQFVENFELNANWSPMAKGTNHCIDDSSVACSTDFDCVSGACDSKALKLRRDLVRLGDLFDMERYLYGYGVNNIACENDPSIIDGAPCPGGFPSVSYYPLLNEGSYIQGKTNSTWPSWKSNSPHDLQYNLVESIATDPINRFNGCIGGAEPSTCWSSDTLEFYCQASSSIYMYQVEDSGRNYSIGANFEYDMDPWNGVTFGADLAGGLDPRIKTSLNGLGCDGTAIANPPGAVGGYCGNGIIDVPEICDGGFINNACELELTPFFGVHDWWNEMSAGCNPPGIPEQCTQYEYISTIGGYTSSTFAAFCGGYCGDGQFQNFYEQCDLSAGPGFDDDYTCGGPAPGCTNCQATCNGGTEPAAVCGDGTLSPLEDCDASASPSGLSGWDCTDGGAPVCNTCAIDCTAGVAYEGLCGNGIVEGECQGGATCDPYDNNKTDCLATAGCAWAGDEECDFYEYQTPSPSDTISDASSYACGDDCKYTGGFCGDGSQQYTDYRELCDFADYIAPSPGESNEYAQYGCSDDPINPYTALDGTEWFACTPTIDGYCGDNITDPAFGEFCDTNWPSPIPELSNPVNQYGCADDCLSVNGGWCGDSIVNDGQTSLPRHGLGYGEVCDEGDNPDRDFGTCDSVDCTWNCYDSDLDGYIDSDPSTIGHARILFSGSETQELGPGESTILSLPACRVSDKIKLTMSVSATVDVPRTAVIFVSDLSGSMNACAAGTDPYSSTWNCLAATSLTTTFYGTEGLQTTYEPSTTLWSPYAPASNEDLYNFLTRREAILDALRGSLPPMAAGGGAIDEVWATNSRADIAFVEFASTATSTQFYDAGDRPMVIARTEMYNPSTVLSPVISSGTNHQNATQELYDLVDENIDEYDNFVVVYMGDGPGVPVSDAQAINNMHGLRGLTDANDKHLDIFTISLVQPFRPSGDLYRLRGFMNSLSSNYCDFTPASTFVPRAGSNCGDGIVDCVNSNGEFEQCEFAVNEACDPVTCQWAATANKRYYDYADSNYDISNIYSYIAGIIPLDGITIEIDGDSHFITVPSTTLTTDIEIDMSHLWNSSSTLNRCGEFSGNYFTFRTNFVAPEGTKVILSNGEYSFCPWRNGGATPYYSLAPPPPPAACGGGSEACCAGLSCDAGFECTIAGLCEASCGANSDVCCANFPACDAGLICNGVTCDVAPVACGEIGDACCAGLSCDIGLECTIAGICDTSCGANSQACCANFPACDTSGLACSGGNCLPCGADSQQCCAAAPFCDAGFSCSGGTCGCGADGELCCAIGPSCDPFLSCNDGISCSTTVVACDLDGSGVRDLNDTVIFDACSDNFDVDGSGTWNVNDVVQYNANYWDDAWCTANYVCLPRGGLGQQCEPPWFACDAGLTCASNTCITMPAGLSMCDFDMDGQRNSTDSILFSQCNTTFDVDGDGINTLNDTPVYLVNYADTAWCNQNYFCDPANLACGDPGQPCCGTSPWFCNNFGSSCVAGICP